MEGFDNLTDAQRETLQSFQAVTGLDDIEVALSVLESHSWQLEPAVHAILDPPQPSYRQPTSYDYDEDGVGSSSGNSPVGSGASTPLRSAPANAAPRNEAPAGGVQRSTPSLLSILTFPVVFSWKLGWKIVWTLWSFTVTLLPIQYRPLPRTATPPRSNDPRAAAARFLLNYEQSYGDRHPDFYQGSYSQALEAAKRDLRYLVVVLHSSEHDDTDAFCRTVLNSNELIDYLRDKNIMVWAGDIREPEAFKVSNVLSATRYPFLGIIGPQGSRMVVIERVEGPRTASQIITTITRVTDRMDGQIAAIRAERQAQSSARTLREQQDEAYQASLRADQEKERKAREEAERAERERAEEERKERERVERREAKAKRKETLRETLPPEPDATEPELAKLAIRLPSGERLARRFRAADLVQLLYDFIETHDLSPLDLEAEFEVVNTYPRKVIRDMGKSLREVGLSPSASVIVEERVDSEEEE
ncbi:FAS-associated factor 2 [Rhizophlyctis rosea]|uniref:FAS-associated factor 2 n=1 Tax=Rhizophlyctis rosea TaxID=64517 RepID=A0AAD5WZX1_9FUNG|nr:FAS-associated factor 2 [Rhizophlyctis rosea]